MRAGEPLDDALVAKPQARLIEKTHFGEFVCHRFVRRNDVEVSAFHHEGAWGDQCGHLGIIEGAAEVELEDFIFGHPDVTIRTEGRSTLPYPVVEVARTDGQTIDRKSTRLNSSHAN